MDPTNIDIFSHVWKGTGIQLSWWYLFPITIFGAAMLARTASTHLEMDGGTVGGVTGVLSSLLSLLICYYMGFDMMKGYVLGLSVFVPFFVSDCLARILIESGFIE
jgi:hypothetical protein